MKIYKYFLMAALAIMGLAATSCIDLANEDNPAWHMWTITVKGESVANDQVTIPAGETRQLNLVVDPNFKLIVDPVWKSTNNNVATVDENGLLTTLRSGETTIRVYSWSNPNICYNLTLIVTGGTVKISSSLVDQKDAD